MKYLIIVLITFYQNFFSQILKSLLGINSSCRFTPTCSEYAKQMIKEKGTIMGIYNSLIRLLKCQPFYNQNIEYDRS